MRSATGACCLLMCAMWPLGGFAETNLVETRNGWFYLNGERLFVKGVCIYEYHMVTGHFERVSHDVLDYEFARIREAGFNAIRSQLRPDEIALARAHGLLVHQCVDDLYFSKEYLDPVYVEQLVGKTRTNVTCSMPYDNILCYQIDNEPNIPDGLYRQGKDAAEQFYQTLIGVAKEVDTNARVTMASYPCAGFLDHSIFDCVSVNVYAYCPGRGTIGYRGHVKWFKDTYAQDKPLLITEYGQPVSDGDTNLSENMMELLDEQIAGGACGSFFFTWRTFGPEGEDDNGWFGIVPNSGGTNDYRNEPRPIFNAFKKYFEAVVIQPVQGGCYTGSMPVEVYGSDRTGSMQVEVEGQSFSLTRTGTYWWAGSVPVTATGARTVAIEARDTQDVVLVRKECPVYFVDQVKSLSVSIEPETNRLLAGETCRAWLSVVDQDGDPVPNARLRIGVTETERDPWTAITSETRTDETGTRRFVWESALPGYLSVMAQAVPDQEDCLLRPGAAFVRVDTRAACTNLLDDPGFEKTTNGPWTFPPWLCQTGWALRSGSLGMGVPGWLGTAQVDISQTVPATTGTYTFSLWIRAEEGYNAQQTYLALEWLDATGAVVALPVTRDYSHLPQDSGWHPVFVTGTCTDPRLAKVRAVLHAAFGPMKGDPCSLMMDDAALYEGCYVGVCTLSSAGFEDGQDGSWLGSKWHVLPGSQASGRADWAGRSGWGVGLLGWDNSEEEFMAGICQNLAPGTGTYTFSTALLCEPNFLLTNMELRLEWYDSSCSNKVQPDGVSRFLVPPDNTWHRYSVTGTCTSAALFELRAVVFAQFRGNPTNVPLRGMKIDDARFVPREPDTDGDLLPDSWERGYFDSTTAAEPDVDTDGDGRNNYEERVAGTDPTDPHSILAVRLEASANPMSIGFQSSLRRIYTLQFSANLCRSDSWEDVQSHIEGQGGAMELTDTTDVDRGYYRVVAAQ